MLMHVCNTNSIICDRIQEKDRFVQNLEREFCQWVASSALYNVMQAVL